MPVAFSRSQIEAIASLAHLRLDEEEIELYSRQLGDILEYAQQVQRIDTTGVPHFAGWMLVIGSLSTLAGYIPSFLRDR